MNSACRCVFMNRNQDVRDRGAVCVYERELMREREREESLQVEERGGSLQRTKEWREGGNGKDMTTSS